MSPVTSFILNGDIQRAKNEASALKYIVKEAPDGWRLWIWQVGAWVYIAKVTREDALAPLIEHYFPQPD